MTQHDAERGALPPQTSLLGPAARAEAPLATTAIARRALDDLARIEGGSLIVRGPCEHYHWYPRLPAPHVFVRGADAALLELDRRGFSVVVVGWDVPPEAAERVRSRLGPETCYLCFRATFYVWTAAYPEGQLLSDWNSGQHCPAYGGVEFGERGTNTYTIHVACWGAGGNELCSVAEQVDTPSVDMLEAVLDRHLGRRSRVRPAQRPRPDGSVPRPVLRVPDA